ncbi:tRNA preQ1(34) S-adenosylmethionine ribosyltransferase-isomerase QueA [Arsenicitalea aurantiaca]|uniref:S-adenosylmethionine:tRNA ribosyltransferase-isomerase n=1 Tax=Arsenicitalea aurantiaca TaxID=1783274 RepID=A0A433XFL0_9HYPH|nr:tRNA preQ1(34) S-adenosylmethionine ribosyltransferase-isomerase QueA [Arsenicitalea aurantiaca]RUT32846.1 tRNA preQ1(34) S-adenosylmethionine ribosyltransferase-isomerase QueA [Arsenicitalea aurantiaca]
MRVDEFDFELPDSLIALHPVEPRDAARLLVVDPATGLADRHVRDLVDILAPGDVLVVNDTRVLPAALTGERIRGESRAAVSFNLHKRVDAHTWRAFARPAKRLGLLDRLELGEGEGPKLGATLAGKGDTGEVTIEFDLGGAELDEAIKAHGAMPLPPYIGSKRKPEARDAVDYQTVYAAVDGAVAAPTAGLHFTETLLQALSDRSVGLERVTLHVGAGTFLPVKVEDTAEHRMHAEWGEITEATVHRLNARIAAGGRIIAVGTTSLRLLETAARATGRLAPFSGETDIFITPGFRFRVADMLMTNFHLPRSTLFMLVSAFSGLDTMRDAYRHAIEDGYRFYSYGDASLLMRDRSRDEDE